MCLARFGSPATACVDQAEDLSPQSSPFRDAWIGKNVRNKRVSDRVLFPSPAPLQLSRYFQLSALTAGAEWYEARETGCACSDGVDGDGRWRYKFALVSARSRCWLAAGGQPTSR